MINIPIVNAETIDPLSAAQRSRYFIWTVGCQMNKADSERMGSALEQMGLERASVPKNADVIVLNSCVVRQNAEDKVVGMLTSLKPWRERNAGKTLALMGCMVGPKNDALKKRFPFVDVFMQPQKYDPLINLLGERMGIDADGCVGPLVPPDPHLSTFVPIIHGCDKFCSFCIIPYRRGREVSRTINELVQECKMLANRGVIEVTLLGQNVDSYGHDLPNSPDLSDLLEAIHEQIPAIKRIRFLTSHPNDMSERIIGAVARFPRVMEHINLPFQAGHDSVLANMRRGYTNADYKNLIVRIRNTIPDVSLATDLIVGFPGETEEQFEKSLEMLREVSFDKVHVAAYSTRPGTIAERKMEDDVPLEEKTRRLKAVEALQEQIATERNANYLDRTVEVLIEGKNKGKWQGRTRTDKLVFVENEAPLLGQLVNVRITRTSPWSLQGTIEEQVLTPPRLGR